MRITLATLLMSLAIGSGTGFPQVSGTSAKDFAVGGGSVIDNLGNERHFAFSAHARPTGPSGHVVLTQVSPTFGDFELRGDVVCLTVLGNLASIGVRIDKGTGSAAGQTGIILFVQDNDLVNVLGVRDEFANSGFVADPTVCPVFDPSESVTRGNINVNDALF